MIVKTIINSSKENPCVRKPRRLMHSFSASTDSVLESMGFLPIRIICSIHPSFGGKRIHAKHVVSSPATGIGVILNGAQTPLGLTGHWIHGDFSKVPHLSWQRGGRRRAGQTPRLCGATRAGHCSRTNPDLSSAATDSFSCRERFQIRRISLATDFDTDQVLVRVILI